METNEKAVWFVVNEDNDEGILYSGKEAFEFEREALRAMGAPDTDKIVFRDIVPEDRDSAIAVGSGTPAFVQWLVDNGMLEDWHPDYDAF
jgi:hypothetical protein